jgi:hypothetical protein
MATTMSLGMETPSLATKFTTTSKAVAAVGVVTRMKVQMVKRALVLSLPWEVQLPFPFGGLELGVKGHGVWRVVDGVFISQLSRGSCGRAATPS